MRRLATLAAAALTLAPIAALAQPAHEKTPRPPAEQVAPLPRDALMTAWRVNGRAPRQHPTIVIGDRPIEQRIAEAPIRARPEWSSTEGLRLKGAKLAYSQHF